MVAFHSFGSQRAPEAMAAAYRPAHLDDNRFAAAEARTRSGWAIVDRLFPGRLYDHTVEIRLMESSFPDSREVWLGEFGDTVVYMLPSDVENGRVNREVGADRPVRAELVIADTVTLAYVDETAGIDRFVEFGPDATRGAVREAARGEPLPFEEPFLDGPDDEVFPRNEYLTRARSWLFGLDHPPIRQVPPAATRVRGYVLGPVDGPLPLADGRPLVDLAHPDEVAELMAGSEWLDERDGRYCSAGGDWFQLHRLAADRALFVGNDIEDTESYFAGAAVYFGAAYETDLFAGVPEWWREVVHERHPGAFLTDGREIAPINMLCGWDGKQWTKAVGAPDPVLLDHFLEMEEDDSVM